MIETTKQVVVTCDRAGCHAREVFGVPEHEEVAERIQRSTMPWHVLGDKARPGCTPDVLCGPCNGFFRAWLSDKDLRILPIVPDAADGEGPLPDGMTVGAGGETVRVDGADQ